MNSTFEGDTEDKEAAKKPPRKALARLRNGIRHNSQEEINGPQDNENVKAETNVVIIAQKAVNDLDRAESDASNSTRPFIHIALSAIYAVIFELNTAGTRDEFLKNNHIIAHGNTVNVDQPIVAYFFRRLNRPYVRQTVSRLASVVAVGMHLKLDPAGFKAAIAEFGVENLEAQYKTIKKHLVSPEDQEREEALAKAILADPGTAVDFPATPETVGYVGRRLAVLQMDGSGNGIFKLLAVLPHAGPQITKMLAAIANKRATE